MDRTVSKRAAILLELVYRTETRKTPPQCYDVIFGNRQTKLSNRGSISKSRYVLRMTRRLPARY